MQHNFEAIVREALNEPGKISAAYSAFYEYSLGNQWLAIAQLGKPEPISTYPGWKAVGRQVKKGSKAIELIMPIFRKAKSGVTDDEQSSVYFIARRNWFGLSSTEGQDYVPPPLPDFSTERALNALNILQEPFQAISGNCMGYAKTDARTIAVSPLAFDGTKTLFHETAHCLLHPGLVSADDERPAKDVRECEAELTAYLVCSALGHTANLEYARGYIQNWIGDATLERIRFGKVYGAADAILHAGRPTSQPQPLPVPPL